jgi:hypothetical protein
MVVYDTILLGTISMRSHASRHSSRVYSWKNPFFVHTNSCSFSNPAFDNLVKNSACNCDQHDLTQSSALVTLTTTRVFQHYKANTS